MTKDKQKQPSINVVDLTLKKQSEKQINARESNGMIKFGSRIHTTQIDLGAIIVIVSLKQVNQFEDQPFEGMVDADCRLSLMRYKHQESINGNISSNELKFVDAG